MAFHTGHIRSGHGAGGKDGDRGPALKVWAVVTEPAVPEPEVKALIAEWAAIFHGGRGGRCDRSRGALATRARMRGFSSRPAPRRPSYSQGGECPPSTKPSNLPACFGELRFVRQF